jgi:hypothetical protein
MKGALKAMLLMKLKAAVAALMVVAALIGASGVAYQVASPGLVQGQTTDTKPRSELETLRRENELMKLNLEVVLEKVRAQEAELRTLKARVMANSNVTNKVLGETPLLMTVKRDSAALAKVLAAFPQSDKVLVVPEDPRKEVEPALPVAPEDLRKEVESALKALQQAGGNKELLRQATEKLEAATKKLRERLKDPRSNPQKP